MNSTFRCLTILLLFALCVMTACDSGDNDDASTNLQQTDDDQADDDLNDDADDDLDDDDDVDDDLNDDHVDDGPYPVGNKTFIFVDETRGDPATEGPRTLVTEVWYPATDDSMQMPRDIPMNFFAPWEDEVWDTLAGLGVPEEEIDLLFHYELSSARDAPLRPRDRPYPLVIFSHGNGSIRFQNFTLCEHLAKNGFIVVAPNHTGNALGSPLPDRLVGYNQDLFPLAYFFRPVDIVFLIDQFLGEIPNDEIAEFVQLIDPEKVAAGGMSYGGYAGTEAAKNDNRIKAAYAFSSPMFPWGLRHFDTPTLFAFGQEDRTIDDYLFTVKLGYVLAPAPKYSLNFINAGHYSFSDLCILVPTLAGQEDGCGDGTRRSTGETFSFLEHEHMTEIINAYMLAFLKSVFYSDEQARQYLAQNHFSEEVFYNFKQ